MRLSACVSLVALPILLAASHGWAAPASKSKEASRFERLKGLAGRWETPDADKDGKPDHAVVYRVTAAGSCVEETLFPGTPKEMVTMYTLDGDDLVMTHYCSLGNQPHMKAQPEAKPEAIEFAFASGGNMATSADLHMDALTLTLTDATHLRHVWKLVKDGKPVQDADFSFVKAP